MILLCSAQMPKNHTTILKKNFPELVTLTLFHTEEDLLCLYLATVSPDHMVGPPG